MRFVVSVLFVVGGWLSLPLFAGYCLMLVFDARCLSLLAAV